MPRIILFLLISLLSLTTSAEPLPANEVFSLSASVENPKTVLLTLNTKPGYFLYQNRLQITSPNADVYKITDIQLPKSDLKKNHLGNPISIYRQRINIPVTIQGQKPGKELLNVHYQGCSDDGFCYPPQNKAINLTLNNKLQLSDSQLVIPTISKTTSTLSVPTKEKDIVNLFSQRHHATVLLIFFGFGLLLSFTPCVLPMIPVLSSIIIGHGEEVTTRKAFFVSLSYVLSMAFTYAIVGALVALIGSNLQLLMQSSLVIALFSLVFVLLSLSMFGIYELKLPVSWQTKLTSIQRKQNSGHYLGAAIMGCLSTLILSPCVTAPLIGALSYIAHTGEVIFGSLTLFFLGLGMGVPLLIIGTSAGRYLPKAGQWMNQVKAFFGILLLAIAIYLSSRILPGFLTMLLWASLLIFSGVYAGAFQPSQLAGKRALQSGGMILFIYGFLILIGAAMGSEDPVKPLTGLVFHRAPTLPVKQDLIVRNQIELKEAIKQANGKPIFIDFYADWCASCKAMDKGLLKKANIQKALSDFVIIKADVTRLGAPEKEMLQSYGVVAPPTFIFLDRYGNESKEHRLVGEQSEKTLSKHLENVNK